MEHLRLLVRVDHCNLVDFETIFFSKWRICVRLGGGATESSRLSDHGFRQAEHVVY